ncbi:MAG: rRNA maturation RNase YbeY [Rhodospirillales bacterium]|nr:rRNA maturation RNase YbeY [Rhodospirillales bacterium]QQS14800.1 MAG: rRNA maturation RNase YbeY [Rhodospirillales bacterium]
MSAPRRPRAARVEIVVDIRDRRWLAASRTVRALCRRAATAALDGSGRKPRGAVALTIALTSDAAVRRLNRDFRGKDRPTNVLSFPADSFASAPGAPRHLGDIALALETVRREARAQDKRVADHLAHLVVHGTLHLLGHDHEDDSGAAVMERREIRVLAGLGIADPYA